MKACGSKLILFFALLALLSACSTTTQVKKLGSGYQAKDKECEIQFFKDTKPNKPYEAIGKVESHIKKNFFFGGKVQLEDEAFRELHLKACLLGGDAVIIDDYIESSASEMSYVHVWATVLKLSK